MNHPNRARPGARGIRKKNAWARRKGFPSFAAFQHALANNLRNILQALNGTPQHTNPGHARTMRKGSGLSARRYHNVVKLGRSFERLCRDLEGWRGDIIVDDLRDGEDDRRAHERFSAAHNMSMPVIRPPEVVKVQAA